MGGPQDYTVISWDRGTFPFPFPIPIQSLDNTFFSLVNTPNTLFSLVRDGRMMERKLNTLEVVSHLTSCVGRTADSEGGVSLARMESTVSSYNATSR